MPKFYNDFIILVISSFEMTKVVPFSTLTTPLPHNFLWIASSIAEADAIVANRSSTFLAKGMGTFINSRANLSNKVPRNPPD